MTSLSETSLLAGAAGQSTGYEIDQSIRFNATDTAHMERTPSSSGNRKIFTSSFWVKLGKVETNGAVGPGVGYGGVGSAGIVFTNTGTITAYTYYTGSSWTGFLQTNRKFRDPSAWYHIVYIVDSTQGTAGDRIRLYVNGKRETSFANENYLAKDTDTNWNTSGSKMQIGRDPLDSSGYDFDGYLAEMHYLDGYAYGPEYFGEFKTDTDIWIPKEYEGSYGTNGFYIDGRDSGDLGDDESGNGNDFSTTGLAAHDQIIDTPTNNFAVLSPVDTFNRLGNGILRNGNLELKGDVGSNNYRYGRATFGFDVTDSNGWYWESVDVVDGSGIGGITEYNSEIPSSSSLAFTGARGFNSNSTGNHNKLENTTYNSTSLGVTSNAGDIIQFCVKNGKLFIGINGTYVLSGNPATEANPLFTGLTGIFMPFAGLYDSTSYNYNTIHNFGQDGTFAGTKTAQGNTDANGFGNFFYAPPTGAKALCSRSLGA